MVEGVNESNELSANGWTRVGPGCYSREIPDEEKQFDPERFKKIMSQIGMDQTYLPYKIRRLVDQAQSSPEPPGKRGQRIVSRIIGLFRS